MLEARRRIPPLQAVPAAVHWLSVEPLLEQLDLRPWLAGLDWVIVGGESGGGIGHEIDRPAVSSRQMHSAGAFARPRIDDD